MARWHTVRRWMGGMSAERLFELIAMTRHRSGGTRRSNDMDYGVARFRVGQLSRRGMVSETMP